MPSKCIVLTSLDDLEDSTQVKSCIDNVRQVNLEQRYADRYFYLLSKQDNFMLYCVDNIFKYCLVNTIQNNISQDNIET